MSTAVAMESIDRLLVERVRSRLARSGEAASPARVAAALRSEGTVLGDRAVLAVAAALRSELLGAGPLEPLLADPAVTDVLVNGPGEVWVDRGGALELTAVRFPDAAAVRALASRLAIAAGRRLDETVPWVDARLPGGIRLHAVLPPIAPEGPLLSLRVLRRRPWSLDDLVQAGSLAPRLADWLRAVVAARLSFLVTGGTGSGKTTVLATMLGLCPDSERIVLVEDSGELAPDAGHVVRLEARPANLEGAGAIALRDLVRQSLRMRPDRLVVGEVRGAEVVDLLAALNTGHEGGCGTLHANAVRDVPARVEALAVAAGMGREAAHSQLAAGVQVVVHLSRPLAGARRVEAVGVVRVGSGGRSEVAIAVGSAGDGAGLDDLRRLLTERGVTP